MVVFLLNELLLPVIIQIMIIFASLSFTGALVLYPLSPASKRLGYTFIVPLLMIGFVRILNPKLSSQDLILIASYSMPVLLLILTVLKHSFKNNTQMIGATFALAASLILVVYQSGDSLIEGLNSPVILTLLIVVHVALLVILRQQKRTLDWIIFSFLLVGNLMIVYKNIGTWLPFGYSINAAGYALALRSIYIEHQYLHLRSREEHEEIQNDFKGAVEREVRRQTKRMEWVKEQIKEKSRFDDLTGALSKKPLLDLMDTYIHSKDMRKFSILMFDIDKFKGLNDTHGHIVGDRCLKTLVTIAISTLRENDSVGRYGGDEFFIILPDQNASQALKIADRYRQNVQEQTDPTYTISIGIATYPWDGETHKELIKIADDGLYKSKELGRNRVSYTGYLKLDHQFDPEKEKDRQR